MVLSLNEEYIELFVVFVFEILENKIMFRKYRLFVIWYVLCCCQFFICQFMNMKCYWFCGVFVFQEEVGDNLVYSQVVVMGGQ